MDGLFPFGFPSATAAYLVLYVVTLVLHVVFMSYVLAGAAMVAAAAVLPGGWTAPWRESVTLRLLRDWLPFMLGAAVTAGIAPLLFVQVLYQRPFYSAQLLLFHRWMSIVPVLIVGYYLLYLSKSRAPRERSAVGRWAVGVGAWLCFIFTGCSWTESHLLALAESAWPGIYESQRMLYVHRDVYPRILMWFFGTFPIMSAIVGWQVIARRDLGNREKKKELARLSTIARGGIVIAAVCAAIYYVLMNTPTREACLGTVALPYLIAAVAGLLTQVAAWTVIRRTADAGSGWLALASVAAVGAIACTAVVREAIRMQALDVTRFFAAHEKAACSSGRFIFLFFLAVNAAVIAWCIGIVRKGAASASAPLP